MIKKISFQPSAAAWTAVGVLLLALAASPALGHTSEAAEAGVSRLVAATGGATDVRMDRASGVARFIRFPGVPLKSLTGDSPEAKAGNFLNAYGSAFGIRNPATELQLIGVHPGFMDHVAKIPRK